MRLVHLKQALTKRISLVITLMFVSLITGCASSVDIAKQLNEQQVMPSQEGVVVARVINTTSYPLPMNQLFFNLKTVNASEETKPIIAYAQDKPVGDSTLFAVTLPPGEYALGAVTSFASNGNFFYRRGTRLDPEFGVFKVKAGEVTDLGTMVYYPKPQDERYKDIVARVPETENGRVLERYFPKFAVAQDKIISWDEDELEEQRFLTYASIAQNPVNFGKIIEAPDDTLYLLGKLGVILVYKKGEFDILAVDTDLALNDLAANQAGDIITGGHEGSLFFLSASSNNGEWQRIDIPENATVHYVKFQSENQFDVIYSSGLDVVINRYNSEDMSLHSNLNTYTYVKKWALQEVAATEEKNQKPKVFKPQPINKVNVSDEKGEITVFSKAGSWSFFDSGDAETYAFEPDSWNMREQQENENTMDVVVNAGAAQLGIKLPGFWSWTGQPSYFSRADKDQIWTQVSNKLLYCKNGTPVRKNGTCKEDDKVVYASKKDFSFISRPWFYNEREGLAITSFVDVSFWSGERSTETKILLTEDAGQSWSESDLSLPQKYCSDIITEVKDRILLSCEGATSDFYESLDKGVTWQHVRQQQDF